MTLASPERAAALGPGEWDFVVRIARGARLLGVIRARLERTQLLGAIPPEVRAQLEGAWRTAAYRRQMVLREMWAVAKVLVPLGVPLVALKGAAYIAQGLRCAEGRLPEDLDLMVPRDRLDEVEQALVGAGWASETTDPYDQRYYRVWSHELPPMRFAGHPIELDVHHTILPPVGRVRPEDRALFEGTVPIPGFPFGALSPADQVLHACAHLFESSDCIGRLRDLVDIDGLLREHAATPGFWTTLLVRARLHRLGRSLWYALHYGQTWLGTPCPENMALEVARLRPAAVGRAVMDRMIPRALLPQQPDEEPTFGVRLARFALVFRSMWLRMPPWLLAYHSAAKLVRHVRRPQHTG